MVYIYTISDKALMGKQVNILPAYLSESLFKNNLKIEQQTILSSGTDLKSKLNISTNNGNIYFFLVEKACKQLNEYICELSNCTLLDNPYLKNALHEYYKKHNLVPSKDDECLADADYYQVGDTITITEPANESDLKTHRFKVTGTIYSPLYTGTNYGSSQIGDGTLYSYMFVLKDTFQYDVYTEIYVTLKQSSDDMIYSSNYKDNIEQLKKERINSSLFLEFLVSNHFYKDWFQFPDKG